MGDSRALVEGAFWLGIPPLCADRYARDTRQPPPTQAMKGVAAIRWVEHGTPPDKLMAEHRDGSGKVIRTRPLFPYPQVAKYKGNGSTDEAENFVSSPRVD